MKHDPCCLCAYDYVLASSYRTSILKIRDAAVGNIVPRVAPRRGRGGGGEGEVVSTIQSVGRTFFF
jgi:hypothetical protein